jgi:methylated-DNA-[protein]-cysteine S-methyltransferase/AraC family transcriptional regulator of adaptative response/methylated-DNA-[protein]-cysteine methyltransferase
MFTKGAAREACSSPQADVLFYTVADCQLGRLLIARSDKGVCSVLLGDRADALGMDLAESFRQSTLVENKAALKDEVARVLRYIEKPSSGLHLRLDMRGTPFQRRVWEKLKAITVGRTVGCCELAHWISALANPRVVAGACVANRIALAIPCHRVVSDRGVVAAYGWGAQRKSFLLEKEAMK